MAKIGAKAAVAMAVGAMVLSGGRAAAEAEAGTVVLHVADYAHVPAGDMAIAQRAAARVYARFGVRVVWTDGYAAAAGPDGARHLDVLVLTPEMTVKEEPAPHAFGRASSETRRAQIYYGRTLAHALATHSDPALVLALVHHA